MKKFLVATFFAATAVMGLSSCMNGDYDANPTATNSGGNPLNPGGGNGGGGGSSFNWSGTAPMSANIDGNGWLATGTMYMPAMGTIPATVTGTGPNNSAILVSFPETAAPNTVVDFGTAYSASWTTNNTGGDPNSVFGSGLGGGGSVQILENDATHVKGKFFFTGKNIAGTSANISEGYFEATK